MKNAAGARTMSHISTTIDRTSAADTASPVGRDMDAPARQQAQIGRLGWRKLLLAGVALVGLGAAADLGRTWWTTGRFEVSTDDAYVKADTTVIAPKISGYISQV